MYPFGAEINTRESNYLSPAGQNQADLRSWERKFRILGVLSAGVVGYLLLTRR